MVRIVHDYINTTVILIVTSGTQWYLNAIGIILYQLDLQNCWKILFNVGGLLEREAGIRFYKENISISTFYILSLRGSNSFVENLTTEWYWWILSDNDRFCSSSQHFTISKSMFHLDEKCSFKITCSGWITSQGCFGI